MHHYTIFQATEFLLKQFVQGCFLSIYYPYHSRFCTLQSCHPYLIMQQRDASCPLFLPFLFLHLLILSLLNHAMQGCILSIIPIILVCALTDPTIPIFSCFLYLLYFIKKSFFVYIVHIITSRAQRCEHRETFFDARVLGFKSFC